MSDHNALAAEKAAQFRQIARTTLAQRMVRNRYFDRQAFGGQRWDLMLALFAEESGSASVDLCGKMLNTPPATTLALARILAGHGLIELGDSAGGWNEIPIRLSANGLDKMSGFFTELTTAAQS